TVTPLSFPIGMGYDFKGIYNIFEKNINLFSGNSKKNIEETISFEDLDSPELEKIIGSKHAKELRENLELVDGVYPDFDKEAYLKAQQQPVFFGSALNNFGVRELLDCFIQIAPPPRSKMAEERLVHAREKEFSGFVRSEERRVGKGGRSRWA